jgi:hypothetical protein
MKTCECCGREFAPNNRGQPQRFCGGVCQRRQHRKNHPVTHAAKQCGYCGKTFTPHIRSPGQQFCDSKCQRRQRRRRQTANNPPQPQVRKCAVCPASFTLKPRHPHQRFCSRQCSRRISKRRWRMFQPGTRVEWEYRGTWRSRGTPRIKLRGVVTKPGRVVQVFCAGATHEVFAFQLRPV